MKTRIIFFIVVLIAIAITVLVLNDKGEIYDSSKYHTVFGAGSPLAEIGTGKPLLSEDNCKRYANWLSEHQKEKITLREDFSQRYPPWGNQIFPLVDYCNSNGELIKTVLEDKILWRYQVR